MVKRYFDDPKDNVAFERCVDVLAELIEKYAGLFALSDIGYEHYLMFASAAVVTSVFSFEDYRNRFCNYYKCSAWDVSHYEQNGIEQKCRKAG